MGITISKQPLEDRMYDLEPNIEMATEDIRSYIKEHGKITMNEYGEVARHYRINNGTLFASTHPYSYWCFDCGLIVTYNDWNSHRYKCHSCATKYVERMKGFVMQKPYEGNEKLTTDDLITAIKITSNYEADLYIDGRLVMSCLGFEHEHTADILKEYGVIQYYKNNRLAWKYEDESKNVYKVWVHFFEYMWDGVRKVQFNVHDYQDSPKAIPLNSLNEAKMYALLLYPDIDEIVFSVWLDNESYQPLKHTKDKGWVEGW